MIDRVLPLVLAAVLTVAVFVTALIVFNLRADGVAWS